MRVLRAAPQVERPAEIQEVVGQKRLADKVSGILERIEKELDSVEHSIGESMHVLDTDNDGMVGPPHPCSLLPSHFQATPACNAGAVAMGQMPT